MARPLVLSNGDMHVGINKYGLVHDFYYPYVGLENHSAAEHTRHRVGVWVEGAITWLDEPGWTHTFRYAPEALVGHTIARHDEFGIVLEFDDFVDSGQAIFFRNVHIINERETEREIRLFMHQAFVIGDGRSNTDTAQFLPDSDAIVHYRGKRVFIVSGTHDTQYFDQHAIGLFGIEGREGTWRDADDGELACSMVEHGQVDSTLRFPLRVGALSSTRVSYWIAAGTTMREALHAHRSAQQRGLARHLETTQHWWKQWLAPASKLAERLPKKQRKLFIESALIIKSHIDNRGAIIASTDTTMLNYLRDAYAYSWPRDGAYIIWPLIRLGYTKEPRRFFEFCRRGLHPAGYLMHKYRADGALGSSWHPYVHGDAVAPPIQEDETALVLFVFAQFYRAHQDEGLLDEFYDTLIVPMADFLADYVDPSTGLPKPSYDLWEEVHATSTYTTAVVHAALVAAAELADACEDSDRAVSWRNAAEDIRDAAHKHLYNPDRKVLYKNISTSNGDIVGDETIDVSAIFGSFMFGLFAQDSPELSSSITTMVETFTDGDTPARLPRYENDTYHRSDDSVTGNWWFITSLWLAQYYIEIGKRSEAQSILDWVADQALSSGVLSEQVNPTTSTFASVAPLAWSHAEYLSTVLDTATDA